MRKNNHEIWSEREKSELVSLWNKGKSSIEISKIIQRSAQAIRVQLWNLKVSATRLEMEILDRKRRGLSIRMKTKPDDPRLIKLPKDSLPEVWAHGKPWTPELDAELTKDWESGMELLPILKKYGRTPFAIFAKLCLLGELSEELNPYVNTKEWKKEFVSTSTLNPFFSSLIEKYLSNYQAIERGEVIKGNVIPPKSSHNNFRAVCKGEQKAVTAHEKAYMAWKKEARPPQE